MVLIALFFAMAVTDRVAYDCRAAETRAEDRPAVSIIRDIDHEPLENAMAAIHAGARRDPASAAPIVRVRKAE